MARICSIVILAAALAGCGGAQGDVYIALQSDFAPYESWPKVALGDAPLAGHPAGQRFGYVSARAAAGATQYPVGTVIVKTVEAVPDDVTKWDLFAMVKRGGGYNGGGARDWEFFILKLTAQRTPVIVDRGANPSDAGDGGSIYGDGAMGGVTCNACHGALGTERTDHILSPLLQPGAQ
jgi:hypothetical protein